MSLNASAALIANPAVIYSTLALYGLLLLVVLLYVSRKFSGAKLLLNSLKKDWDSAETTHTKLMKDANEHVSRLAQSATNAPDRTFTGPKPVTFDTRN